MLNLVLRSPVDYESFWTKWDWDKKATHGGVDMIDDSIIWKLLFLYSYYTLSDICQSSNSPALPLHFLSWKAWLYLYMNDNPRSLIGTLSALVSLPTIPPLCISLSLSVSEIQPAHLVIYMYAWAEIKYDGHIQHTVMSSQPMPLNASIISNNPV